jgi:hypothetical protein
VASIKSAKPDTGIPLTPFNQIRLTTSRRDLVKGLLPAEGVCMAWGPYSCGKTFVLTDMMLHVARGRPYRDRSVKQGAVIYCAFEGASGMEARLEAYRQNFLNEMDEADIPFYLCTIQLDLVRDQRKLIEAIRLTIGENHLAACALDTLNRSLAGSENSDQDMGDYFKACDAIREAFATCVIAVHHSGYDDKHARGHTSFCCNAKAVLSIKRDALENITLTVEKMKDGPAGESVTSRLKQVVVGEDDEGDDITSCIVLEAEPAATSASTRGPKLTPNQNTYLTILIEAGKDGMTIEEWNTAAREAGFVNTPKQRFYDWRKALERKRLVHEYAEKYFLTNG